jgi:hypothetical protein
VIVTEALSQLMFVAVNGDFISGFSMGARNDDSLSVSHLLFADDFLIFGGVALDNCWYLRCVLLCFQAASGLKIICLNLN